jgi:hypothetical protein
MTADARGEIRGVVDLLEIVAGARTTGPHWYRGQRDHLWDLKPGCARVKGFLSSEEVLLKQFKRDAVNRVAVRPTNDWEWLALAQHYGLPTRLLDWTEHPLVALYFAAERGGVVDNEPPTDGAFFDLAPEALNKFAYPTAPRILMLGHDSLDDYLPGSASGPSSGPLAVTTLRAFDRVTVQVGNFTVCRNGEDISGSDAIQRWIIPASAKEDIIAELADLNITASNVFPDLAHLAEHLKEEYRQ